MHHPHKAVSCHLNLGVGSLTSCHLSHTFESMQQTMGHFKRL